MTAAVGVVIPARNASAGVERALDALSRQDYAGDWEVVVVDDGSTDGTSEAARRGGAHVVRHEVASGPAAARNAGVAATQAPLLAFTDADCAPEPGWLRAGVAALAAAELVQGRIDPDPGAAVGPFDHTISVQHETLLYETANLFVRRDVFERVGGFRAFIEPAQGHFGEDVVFAWEARRSGARTGFAGDAVVHHAVVARGPSAWLRERLRMRLFPMLTRDVPELRERYVMGVFLSRRTLEFDAAVAAVAFALLARRPLALLGTLPYVQSSRRRGRTVTTRAVLALGDAVGLAALAAGSVRARTPVL